MTSPKITHFSWGNLDIEGLGHFKDAKLWPGGAIEWDWSITGTRHNLGIQPADVDDLLEHGAEIIILSKGVDEKLLTMSTTLDYLQERKIEAHVLQTEQAIETYNRLASEGKAVGALIHSTC